MERHGHLDGVRGIAAAVVAVFHFIRAFIPTFLNSTDPLQYSPLSILWNGHFAVSVFFALSGYIFFTKFVGAGALDALVACCKRYIRLSGPILIASIATLIVHRYIGFSNVDAAATSQSNWLVQWYRFPPDLHLALAEPLFGMYTSFDSVITYNSNLWTIRNELFCVWAIIALAVIYGHIGRNARIALISLAALATINSYAFTFVVGASTAIVRGRRETPMHWTAAASVLFVSCSLGSYFFLAPITNISVSLVFWPFAAAGILYSSEMWPPLTRLLSTKPLQWLGRMSFGIYIVHFVVASSIAAWAFVATQSLAVTFAIYACSTGALAYLFYNLADAPSASVANWVATRIKARTSVSASVTHTRA
jgi:peptidoglycan/LPS O-acetylase OafA/YrhL